MTSEVTQEARNAAADLLHEVGCLLGDDGIGQVADLIRDGEYDDHDATIAFAKFERETIARMNAKPSDDKAIMRELRPSKAAMEKIERMEQANAAGLAEIRNMPFGGAAHSGEGRSGAGDGFEAEQDGDAFTIRFPDGHAITAWRTGRLVVTKSEAGFDPFAIDIAALNARQSGEGEREALALRLAAAHDEISGSPTRAVVAIKAGVDMCRDYWLHIADAALRATDDSDPWFQLGWYKDRLERAETERDIWKERAMSLRIASRKAGLLQTALEDICDPIAALCRYADERGRQLDGAVAFQLANDPNHIKGIARAALRATDDAGGRP